MRDWVVETTMATRRKQSWRRPRDCSDNSHGLLFSLFFNDAQMHGVHCSILAFSVDYQLLDIVLPPLRAKGALSPNMWSM